MSEGNISLGANFLITEDSIFNFISLERPSTKAERNSFTSSFNLAISYTFRSALCELAIIMTPKNDRKMINLQFLNESSLIRNVPLKTPYMLFFILSVFAVSLYNVKHFYYYNFSAILNFALLALLLVFISSCAGIINFPTFLNGTLTFPNTSFSGSPSNIPLLIYRFTNLSSNE